MYRELLLSIGIFLFFATNTVFAAVENLKTPHYLFVGNSKTYYNSMPRMFTNMVAKDKDNLVASGNVRWHNITWGGSSLLEHAQRIRAIKNLASSNKAIKYSNLSANEKKLFVNKARFDVYVDALYSNVSQKKTRTYDCIIIQEQTGNARNISEYKKGANAIVKVLASGNYITNSNTSFVINAIWPAYQSNWSNLKAKQTTIDINSKLVRSFLATTYKDRSFKVAYSGRAFINFLNSGYTLGKFGLNKKAKLLLWCFQMELSTMHLILFI